MDHYDKAAASVLALVDCLSVHIFNGESPSVPAIATAPPQAGIPPNPVYLSFLGKYALDIVKGILPRFLLM